MLLFFLWVVTPSFAQVHGGDTGWWDDSTCAGGENDGPGEYLGGGKPVGRGRVRAHDGDAAQGPGALARLGIDDVMKAATILVEEPLVIP